MATPTSPRPENLIGCTVADRYQVEAAIGDGGMATVYRATQVHLRRPVALKVLKSRYCDQPDSVERFVREARAASAIRSPFVVDILDIGEITGTTVFIAMELLEGPTLEGLLKKEVQLSWSRAQRLALQIVRGLRAVHEHGIVHRDMKPSNCIVTRNDRGQEHIKILDFGIAKLSLSAAEQELTQTGAIFGTAKYMSPEQARGLTVDARTDIYAFGVILYELLAGRVPFDGDNFPQVATQHVKDAPPSLEYLELPEGAQALIERCLAKSPEDRFSSMGELEQSLEAIPEALDDAIFEPQYAQNSVPEGTVVLKDGGLPANYLRNGPSRHRPSRQRPLDDRPVRHRPLHDRPLRNRPNQAVAGAAAADFPEQTLVESPERSGMSSAQAARGFEPGFEDGPEHRPLRKALPFALAGAAVVLVALFSWWSVQDEELQALAEPARERTPVAASGLVVPAEPRAVSRPEPSEPEPAQVPGSVVPPESSPTQEPPPSPAAAQEPKPKKARPKSSPRAKAKSSTRNKSSRSAKPRAPKDNTTLSPAQIRRALAPARRLVQAKCAGPGLRVSIKVEMHVLPSGKLIATRALPPFERSEIGSCVERYARLARFPERDRQEQTIMVQTFALGKAPDKANSP